MALSRLIYLTVMLFCGIFCLAYGQWFSWLLLVSVLIFPWLSLLLSLGAMMHFQATAAVPGHLLMGSRSELWLVGKCPRPMPPFRGTLELRSSFTGEKLRYNDDNGVPTNHCGSYTVTVKKGRVYDYLGLFSLPIRHCGSEVLRILPRPIPVQDLPPLPMENGHFSDSENYELRPYRPGDRLNRIHWKLTAKTGKWLIRETADPRQSPVRITLNLRGTCPELDRKLGRLVWLGNHLLRQGILFELQVLTGSGIHTFPIQDPQSLGAALDTLLVSSPIREGTLPECPGDTLWHYHIGGAPDEPA